MNRLRESRGLLQALVVSYASAAFSCGTTQSSEKCGDCFEQGYEVAFSGEGNVSPPHAVLFSGFRNGWCQQDLVCTGSPNVALGDVKGGTLDWPSKCGKQELVGFAGGHAPTTAVLTPSAGKQDIPLKPPAQLPLTMWIVKGAATANQVNDDITGAASRYADLGAGVELGSPQIKNFPASRLATVPDLYDNASCSVAPTLTAMIDDPNSSTDEPGFDAGRLNVYYVAGFSATSAAPAGLTCADPTGALDPVILIDGEITSSPAVLPHELGHALGLIRSTEVPGGGYAGWGHTNEVWLDPYLIKDNLMRSGGTFVGQITLGQIYRMHFDELSWLWRGQPQSGTYPRKCQGSAVEGGPCPALTRHPPRGWP
jgi:hypothetical protein